MNCQSLQDEQSIPSSKTKPYTWKDSAFKLFCSHLSNFIKTIQYRMHVKRHAHSTILNKLRNIIAEIISIVPIPIDHASVRKESASDAHRLFKWYCNKEGQSEPSD
ncbi:hypothetical protein CDAR_192771 [Caerostris darwini]|uniref:Uncharacterized protein n=1 Tax=Caerostris darwini TaxID=1538125 RepID=A0AAV4MPN7_9ARAC|nr:hypothetical protein CDAR_192771 [Caerostris darwini]